MLLGLSSYLEIMILVNTIMAGNLSIKCIFSKSIRSIKRLLSPYGLILILISFFISNIIHFNLLSRIVENLGLIGHLRNIFMNKPVITVLVVSLLLILLVLFLRYLFVYSILSSGNVSVKKSFRLSAKLMESHYFKTLVKLIWVNTLALFFFCPAVFYHITYRGLVY